MRKHLPPALKAWPVLFVALVVALVVVSEMNESSLVLDARTEPTRALRGATFYLLDEDPIRLAMVGEGDPSPLQAKVHGEHPRLRVLAGLLNARRREAYPLGPDVALLLEQSRPLWETHVVRSARTDERGRAVFEGLKPGDYWVMGSVGDGPALAFWDLRLTLRRGENHLLLDERNALTVGTPAGAR